MQSTQLIDPLLLIDIREQIDNYIIKLNNSKLKEFILKLLDIVLSNNHFNIEIAKKVGFLHVLLVGSDSLDIVNRCFGVKSDGLINGNLSCLVKIQRGFRDNFISFEFRTANDLSPENRQKLINIYKENDKDVAVERYISDPDIKLPSLIFKNIDASCLTNPPDNMKNILGSGLVKEMTIQICVPSSMDIFSWVNKIEIITPGYFDEYHESIDKFIKEHFQNMLNYNIVVLNKSDDYLLTAFIKISEKYGEILEINNEMEKKFLSTIFYSTKGDNIDGTNLFVESPEFMEILNPEKISTNLEIKYSIPGVTYTLNYLIWFILRKSFSLKKEIMEKISKTKEMYSSFNNDKREIEIHGKEIFAKYDEIVNEAKKILDLYPEKHPDRKEITLLVDRYLELVLAFCNKYNREIRYDVLSTIDELNEERVKYLARVKKIFREKYQKTDAEFKIYMKELAEKINKYLDRIKIGISISSLDMFISNVNSIVDINLATNSLENDDYIISEITSLIINKIIDLSHNQYS
jgi:hypothetical protein